MPYMAGAARRALQATGRPPEAPPESMHGSMQESMHHSAGSMWSMRSTAAFAASALTSASRARINAASLEGPGGTGGAQGGAHMRTMGLGSV